MGIFKFIIIFGSLFCYKSFIYKKMDSKVAQKLFIKFRFTEKNF